MLPAGRILALLAALNLLAAPPAQAADPPPPLTLVESTPSGTDLDQRDLPEAHEVWVAMIGEAQRSIRVAQFYVSNKRGSRLDPVIGALEAAAARGVAVKVLADAKMFKTYPNTLRRLGATRGVQVRRYDMEAVTGGVLHAKFMLIDDQQAYLGSQNFDWRSLEHIHELGLRIRIPAVVRALGDVFDTDWGIAGGEPKSFRAAPPGDGYGLPVTTESPFGPVKVQAAFSPTGLLPDELLWDLPQMLQLIDGARKRISVQLLTYKSVGRGTYWQDIETALRRAAARGVAVRLLLSDWTRREGTIEPLQSLAALRNVEVRQAVIPPDPGGFIPFARVIHAKYLAVDSQRLWLGTSNWERGYFYESRNVGLVIDGRGFTQRVERIFDDLWGHRFTEAVDPCKRYQAPRIRK